MTVNKISQLKLFAILNFKKKGAKRAQEKNNEDGEGNHDNGHYLSMHVDI